MLVEEIDRFVIKFNYRPDRPIYAQIFIAKVTLREGDLPPTIVARGLEIEATTKVRHDYTALNPGQDPLKPSPGRPHAFLYSHGAVTVEIITHNSSN